jgi:hypothetical protein
MYNVHTRINKEKNMGAINCSSETEPTKMATPGNQRLCQENITNLQTKDYAKKTSQIYSYIQ